LDTVARRAAGAPRVRTLFCIQTDPIIAAGRATPPSQLLGLSGGANSRGSSRDPRRGAEARAGGRRAVVPPRRLGGRQGRAHLEDAFWRRWPTIPAVAHGRVVVLPDDLTLRPGPRVADAAEELAAILHAGSERAGVR